MVAITFRTAGAWGAGIGADLTPTQVDVNFYNLKSAVETLQANPVQPEQIASITVTGNKMTITLTDATTFGPFTLPIAEFHDRGAWAPATNYVYGDIFTNGTGLYMSLQDFTSAGAFDPAAANGFGPFYRLLFDASGMTMTYLDAGYPAVGVDLHIFEVFSVPDVGVFMVLQDHAALAVFDPDALSGGDPLYKKIFTAIETGVARVQFQFLGTFPADSSLMWKYIQDDPRDLTIATDFIDSVGHLEVACTAAIVFTFKYLGASIGTLTFSPGELLDGVGGQYGAFVGAGATIPNLDILRMTAPAAADATAKSLTVVLIGTYPP